MRYLEYNREERDACAHLFRLLLDDQAHWRPLCQFLKVENVNNPRLFCEVALIRDAYYARRPESSTFISDLCKIIARQEKVQSYTEFGNLPAELRDPLKTHPGRIYHKMRRSSTCQSAGDRCIYGGLQRMFNAKPDLLICEGENLFVYEAKFTLGFDQEQLVQTQRIAEVWAELLFLDMGYSASPSVHVRKLGLECYGPHVSWERVYELSLGQWGPHDFSTRKLKCVSGWGSTS